AFAKGNEVIALIAPPGAGYEIAAASVSPAIDVHAGVGPRGYSADAEAAADRAAGDERNIDAVDIDATDVHVAARLIASGIGKPLRREVTLRIGVEVNAECARRNVEREPAGRRRDRLGNRLTAVRLMSHLGGYVSAHDRAAAAA